MKFMLILLGAALHQSQGMFDWPKDIVIAVERLSDAAAASNYSLELTWPESLYHNVSRFLRHCSGNCQLDGAILDKFLRSLFAVRNGMLKYALSENWTSAIDLRELDVLSHHYTHLFEELVKQGVTAGEWRIEGQYLLSQAVNLHMLDAVRILLRHIYSNPAQHFQEFVLALQRTVLNWDFHSLDVLMHHVAERLPKTQLVEFLVDTSMGRSALDIALLQCNQYLPSCVSLEKLKETFSQLDIVDNKDMKLANVFSEKLPHQQAHIDENSHMALSFEVQESESLMNAKLGNQTDNASWMRKSAADHKVYEGGWRQFQLDERDSVGCDIPVVWLGDLDTHLFVTDYVNLRYMYVPMELKRQMTLEYNVVL